MRIDRSWAGARQRLTHPFASWCSISDRHRHHPWPVADDRGREHVPAPVPSSTTYRFPAPSAPGDRPAILSCQVDVDDHHRVLRLRGELDADSAVLLREVVADQPAQDDVGLDLHLDLAGVVSCDPQGIEALTHLQWQLEEAGGHLLVHRAGGRLRWMARQCGSGGLLDESPW